MGVLVVITRYFDADEKRKSEKVREFVKAGQLLNISEANIDSVSVPAKCKNCDTLNTLIAKDIEKNAEVHEAKGFENCKKCNKDMEVYIGLVESPEGTITFEDVFIEEVKNCFYEKDVELR